MGTESVSQELGLKYGLFLLGCTTEFVGFHLGEVFSEGFQRFSEFCLFVLQ